MSEYFIHVHVETTEGNAHVDTYTQDDDANQAWGMAEQLADSATEDYATWDLVRVEVTETQEDGTVISAYEERY